MPKVAAYLLSLSSILTLVSSFDSAGKISSEVSRFCMIAVGAVSANVTKVKIKTGSMIMCILGLEKNVKQ